MLVGYQTCGACQVFGQRDDLSHTAVRKIHYWWTNGETFNIGASLIVCEIQHVNCVEIFFVEAFFVLIY